MHVNTERAEGIGLFLNDLLASFREMKHFSPADRDYVQVPIVGY